MKWWIRPPHHFGSRSGAPTGLPTDLVNHTPRRPQAETLPTQMVVEPADRPEIFPFGLLCHFRQVSTIFFGIDAQANTFMHDCYGRVVHAFPRSRPGSPGPALSLAIKIRKRAYLSRDN